MALRPDRAVCWVGTAASADVGGHKRKGPPKFLPALAVESYLVMTEPPVCAEINKLEQADV